MEFLRIYADAFAITAISAPYTQHTTHGRMTDIILESRLPTVRHLIHFLIFFLSSMSWYLPSSLLWGAELAASPKPQSYTLGTGENYPPFSDKTLPDGGMAHAIVKAAFAAIEIPVTIGWTSWKRAESQVNSGKFAAIFPYMQTGERAQKFSFSQPIYTMHSFFYFRSADKLTSSSPESLRGKRLCRPTGYGNEAVVQKLLDDGIISLTSSQSQETCFRQLFHKRADLVVEAEVVAVHTIEKSLGAKAGITHLPDPVAKIDLGLMAPAGQKTGPAVIRDFNRGLEIIRKNGTYQEILKRYAVP
jgi:polar amino acid transport system substrate-binding protein